MKIATFNVNGVRKNLKAAGVDVWVRGEPHASDHAPAWIELASELLPKNVS